MGEEDTHACGTSNNERPECRPKKVAHRNVQQEVTPSHRERHYGKQTHTYQQTDIYICIF